jgi:hypothetical protein
LLLYNRIIYVPEQRRKRALKKIDEINAKRARRRAANNSFDRAEATDVWSTNRHRDTINRQLTPSERSKLEAIGID